MLTGRCHCERNVFEIDADLPTALIRCTCSLCAKRGVLHAYFQPARVRATEATSDAVYRWNTKKVAHHFCSACGCSLFSDSPAFERDGSWDGHTRRIGFNARILDGVDAEAFPVEVIDGKHLW